jgi:hypothetical protein
MHKSFMKYNETLGKWCENKHGASKIIDTLETYQASPPKEICWGPTIYYSKQNKRKLKTKVKMLQEKCIVHEAIKT